MEIVESFTCFLPISFPLEPLHKRESSGSYLHPKTKPLTRCRSRRDLDVVPVLSIRN
jgi:hypothetical protein